MFGKCQHPFPDFLFKSYSELEIEVYLSHMIKKNTKLLNPQATPKEWKSRNILIKYGDKEDFYCFVIQLCS